MIAVAQNNMHPEVAQWISKAKANGGIYSSQTINALNLLMTDIKRYGLRNKIFRLNMFVGENSNAGAIPIIADKGNSIDTVVGSPLYTPRGGFDPNNNNTSNYIRTGFNPSTGFTSKLSAHQGCWIFTPYNSALTSQQGCSDSVGNRCSIHYPWSDGKIYSDMYGASGLTRSNTTPYANGTIMQNLICTVNSSINSIYRNGAVTSQQSTGNGSGTVPNLEYTVLGSMGSSGPNGSLNNNYRIGYYTLGTGLTLSDAFLYHKAISDFMTRLGRS